MILKSLNAENYYIDKHSLDLFLSDWEIDSIYEDEDGVEFFDDLAIDKIKRGISLKSKGSTDEQIIQKLRKMEARVDGEESDIVEKKKPEPIQPILVKDFINPQYINEEAQETFDAPLQTVQSKNFTLDVSSQTLQMLAETVAKKISDDIANSNFAEKLIEAGGYKKDNEILAKQVKELLEHNKELTARIEQLESRPSKSFWGRFWAQN